MHRLHQLDAGQQFGSTEAVKQATVAGLGITCLSQYAVRDQVALGRLAILRTPLAPMPKHFHRIVLRARRPSDGVARFAAFSTPPGDGRTASRSS